MIWVLKTRWRSFRMTPRSKWFWFLRMNKRIEQHATDTVCETERGGIVKIILLISISGTSSPICPNHAFRRLEEWRQRWIMKTKNSNAPSSEWHVVTRLRNLRNKSEGRRRRRRRERSWCCFELLFMCRTRMCIADHQDTINTSKRQRRSYLQTSSQEHKAQFVLLVT